MHHLQLKQAKLPENSLCKYIFSFFFLESEEFLALHAPYFAILARLGLVLVEN